MQRREYIATTGVGVSGVIGGCVQLDRGDDPDRANPDEFFSFNVEPIEPVTVGIIGLGNRGRHLTELIESFTPDRASIRAICDIREEATIDTHGWLANQGHDPAMYTGDENAWLDLLERDDLDLVFVFTHYQAHGPMSIAAMEHGHHVATEIPAARTIEECEELVVTAERERKHCIMLENVNYFDEELWLLNMIEEGVFGEVNYAKGAYVHDLVNLSLFENYWDNWRARAHYEDRGDLYPTHGLGPIAHYMDILRGDRFVSLTSTDSPETRMTRAATDLPPDHEFAGETDWANGDSTTTTITTEQGRQITLHYDVKTNRAYTRHNHVQGETAFHAGFPSRLSVDAEGLGELDDATYEAYRDRYRHPLWEELGDLAEEYGGHGGGDWLMLYRLFEALNEGRPLDMNVYEAAAWSAVVPLSAASLEAGSEPVSFREFTRGAWETERTLPTLDADTFHA